jgi:hypothetical protein
MNFKRYIVIADNEIRDTHADTLDANAAAQRWSEPPEFKQEAKVIDTRDWSIKSFWVRGKEA